jgi:hypothetical protein
VKILLVYYEPYPSGQTAHVLSLAQGLDPRRYDLTVVLSDHLERSITAFRQAGARVEPLPLRKVLWSPAAILALVRLIRELEPDLVHVHSQEAGLVARAVAAWSIPHRPSTSGEPGGTGSMPGSSASWP